MVHLEPNEIPSVENLSRSLHEIWNTAKAKKYVAHNVGILTADNRRTWAGVRQELLKGIAWGCCQSMEMFLVDIVF